MVSFVYEAQATLLSTPMSMLRLPKSNIRLVNPLISLSRQEHHSSPPNRQQIDTQLRSQLHGVGLRRVGAP